MKWSGRGWSLALDRPLVMGILNVTPDSFSDGGEHDDTDDAVDRGFEIVRQGADIVDVGGESTRPGAEPVPPAAEIERVVPVVEALTSETDAVVSIDTRNAATARACLDAGAHIVNDVTAGTHDSELLEVVADAGAGIVLMHMQGEPRTMQDSPAYDDVVEEVRAYLVERAHAAEAAGISHGAIAIDPGIGFGKEQHHNIELLRRLDRFTDTGYPVLIGHSRKSLIGHLTGRPVGERLAGSLAVAAYAIWHGANVLRVHDVAETRDLVDSFVGLMEDDA